MEQKNDKKKDLKMVKNKESKKERNKKEWIKRKKKEKGIWSMRKNEYTYVGGS